MRCGAEVFQERPAKTPVWNSARETGPRKVPAPLGSLQEAPGSPPNQNRNLSRGRHAVRHGRCLRATKLTRMCGCPPLRMGNGGMLYGNGAWAQVILDLNGMVQGGGYHRAQDQTTATVSYKRSIHDREGPIYRHHASEVLHQTALRNWMGRTVLVSPSSTMRMRSSPFTSVKRT